MKWLAALLCAGVLAACESPVIPPKAVHEIYSFRLGTEPPSVLRWPSGARVAVHVAARAGARAELLESAFTAAAATWNRPVLFGEYEIVSAGGVVDADVVLRWSDEVAPVDLSGCQPVISRAVTTFCLAADDASRLHRFPLRPPHDTAHSRVRMVVTILGSEASRPHEVERLVAHELGHVLGLADHSPDPQDLMFGGQPTRATLSRRDEATIHVLYHTRPDILP